MAPRAERMARAWTQLPQRPDEGGMVTGALWLKKEQTPTRLNGGGAAPGFASACNWPPGVEGVDRGG
jgi:hypothetical protein